jgi:hypothetical protein
MENTRTRILRQNIETFKAQLPSAADKDSIRRSIKACEDKLREEEAR